MSKFHLRKPSNHLALNYTTAQADFSVRKLHIFKYPVRLQVVHEAAICSPEHETVIKEPTARYRSLTLRGKEDASREATGFDNRRRRVFPAAPNASMDVRLDEIRREGVVSPAGFDASEMQRLLRRRGVSGTDAALNRMADLAGIQPCRGAKGQSADQ